MKPLTPAEMSSLYCGLFATADALRKLGDTDGRAEWCDAMGKTVKSAFLADEQDDKDDKSPWRSEKHPNRPMSPEDWAANQIFFPDE